MKIIQKLWMASGRPCRECGGRGFVVDSDVVAFIERNGLAAFQAAETLMKQRVRRRMMVAVRYAQSRRERDAGDFSAMEKDAGSLGDVALPLEREGRYD